MSAARPGEHTHVFSVCGGLIRMVVVNRTADMDWNDWFNHHPDMGEKLCELMLALNGK